ncbi:hypothetical protein [Rhodoplanes sp. Z2-YC6860]|uniref:hypothetical protein n=1 Tax=Rhodoplanes sp. Z2-YC6860 TaxID=674703 RepID=UPI000834E9C6|nr:hypothetical protein [Rhodoplanes sp. Z2-YC6860]
MKTLCLMACAVFMALAATSVRAGDFSVIRFKDGSCQIWEKADGPPPRRHGGYVRLERNFVTWAEALASMNGLHTQGQCGSIGSLQRPSFSLFPR